jgi:hypothetical protein
VLASDANSFRADASLVQVISRGPFWFQLHKSTEVFGDFGKCVTINQYQYSGQIDSR